MPSAEDPEPVYLKWKGMEAVPEGDFFVRSGPGSVNLPLASAKEYIRTRFGGLDRDGIRILRCQAFVLFSRSYGKQTARQPS